MCQRPHGAPIVPVNFGAGYSLTEAANGGGCTLGIKKAPLGPNGVTNDAFDVGPVTALPGRPPQRRSPDADSKVKKIVENDYGSGAKSCRITHLAFRGFVVG